MKTSPAETATDLSAPATEQAAQNSASAGAAQFGSDRMWGLKELPLPDPVSYWPQTAGWLIVGLLFLLLVAFLAWRLWRRWQYNAYRRETLSRLQAMLSADNDHDDLTQLPLLLRAAALKAGPRRDVASLRGQAWIDWLNHSAGKPVFQTQDADIIDRLPYLTTASLSGLVNEQQRQRLIHASITWIKEHRVSV